MHSQREVKKRPDGAFEVVSTRVYSTADEIIQIRDRLRSDVAATKNLLAQLEAQLADVELAAVSLGNGKGV